MARIGATSRRDLWFATAGIGVGLSTTLLFGALGLGERDQSWMTVALVTLVAVFPTLLAADERLTAGRSALRTGILCLALAVPTLFVLLGTSSSTRSAAETGIVWFGCSLAAAAFASVAYAPALIAGGLLARSASERPAGSIGAGRFLLVLVAGIAAVASWGTVSASHSGGYALWWAVVGLDTLLAALCAAVAVRDAAWAVRLHAVATNRDPRLHVLAGVTAPPTVPHLATPTVRGQGPSFVIARVSAVSAGAYRASGTHAPLLVLDAAPERVVTSLRRSTLLALALAGALAGAAARAPEIAHAPWIPRPLEIAHVPVSDPSAFAEEEERLRDYVPWWLRD